MALPLLPLAAAVGSAFLLLAGGGSKPTTGGEKAVGPYTPLKPSAFQKDPRAFAEKHPRGDLEEPSAELKAYAQLEPWTGPWIDYWCKAMGVPTMPSTLRAKYDTDDGDTTFWSYGRGGYVFALARGLVLGPKGAAKAGEQGEPKAWAQQFVASLEAFGPSKTKGPTTFSWGPIYGLTLKGAQRAEQMGFRPSKWPWVPRDGHPIPLQQILNGDTSAEGKAGHTGFEISKGIMDFIGSLGFVGAIIGMVGKLGLGIGEKASHYDKDLVDLKAVDPDGYITKWGAAQIWAAGGLDYDSKGSTKGDQSVMDGLSATEEYGGEAFAGSKGKSRNKDNTDLMGG